MWHRGDLQRRCIVGIVAENIAGKLPLAVVRLEDEAVQPGLSNPSRTALRLGSLVIDPA